MSAVRKSAVPDRYSLHRRPSREPEAIEPVVLRDEAGNVVGTVEAADDAEVPAPVEKPVDPKQLERVRRAIRVI